MLLVALGVDRTLTVIILVAHACGLAAEQVRLARDKRHTETIPDARLSE